MRKKLKLSTCRKIEKNLHKIPLHRNSEKRNR